MSVGPSLPTPPPGVDLDAEFVNITPERFTSVPRSSHRDGPRRLESLLGLGVLTLYLSNKTGWKIPNAETLAKTWKEGADRIRAAIADLERAGFLVRFRIQGERGRWVTRTFVSADPDALEPIRQYAAALEAAYAAAKAGKSASSGGAFPQVAPDGGFRDPVDRDPVDRDPVDRHPVTGHLKNKKTVLGDQEKNLPPPTPSPAPAAPLAAWSKEEEGDTSNDNPKDPMLAAAEVLADVLTEARVPATRRPTGSKAATLCRHLAERLAAGWWHGGLVDALSEPFDGADSVFAVLDSRIRDLGPAPTRGRRELPEQRTPLPAWCGYCVPATRMATPDMLSADAPPGPPAPCPRCHPQSALAVSR